MARSRDENTSPENPTNEEGLAETLLELASLHYGVPPGADAFTGLEDRPARRQRALELFEAQPELAKHSIHTAAVCGDLGHVQTLLAADPGLAARPGGKEGWPPLLFVCYGRLPLPAVSDNSVAIARALLDCGADPNAHWGYRWDGKFMPWSAVCGAIGDGEGGPVRVPPHPRADELVKLLLDRGADINQGQALYNTMLRGDDEHWLRVFLERGLNARHVGWPSDDLPQTLFELLLLQAARTNQVRRAALLLAHGANPNPSGGEDLYRLAMSRGNIEVAELLKKHGARVEEEPDELTAFVVACSQRDRVTASKLLDQHAELRPRAADLLIDTAATRDLVDLAEFLLSLGVSPNAQKQDGGARALHHAATTNCTRVMKLLLDRGADVDARDERYRATPLAWAIHAQAGETMEMLASKSRDVFAVVAGGLESRLRELLADATLANLTLDDAVGLGVMGGQRGETPLFALPEDEQKALSMAKLLLHAGADRTKRNHAGATASEKARARGLSAVADLLA